MVAANGMNKDSVPEVSWGPVFDDDVIDIFFPAPSTDWVKVKRYITGDDDSNARDAAVQDGMKVLNRDQRRKIAARQRAGEDATTMYFRTGTYSAVLLQRLVMSWSFTRNGSPLPVTPDTIKKLPTHTRDYIMERVNELNPNLGADEEGDVETSGDNGNAPLDLPTPMSSTPHRSNLLTEVF